MGTKVEVYDKKKLKKEKKLTLAEDENVAKITKKEYKRKLKDLGNKRYDAKRVIDYTGKGKSGEWAKVGDSTASMIVEPEWFEQRQDSKWKSQKNKLMHQKMEPVKVKKAKPKATGGIIKMSSGGAAKRGYGKARR
jgi:hypothetical protein